MATSSRTVLEAVRVVPSTRNGVGHIRQGRHDLRPQQQQPQHQYAPEVCGTDADPQRFLDPWTGADLISISLIRGVYAI